ncbi:MAG: helix-hairpin-helix domain-containing protein [Thermoplasmata archaeon]|nr:helix-hairpin-helix domain-containing protein [Thermoplasmata archaeon]
MLITLSENPHGTKIKKRLGLVRKALSLPEEALGLPPKTSLLEDLFDEGLDDLVKQVAARGGNALIGLRVVPLPEQGVVLLYGEAVIVSGGGVDGIRHVDSSVGLDARDLNEEIEQADAVSLFTSVLALSRERAVALYSAGYRNLKDVADADIRDLLKVPGMNPTIARRVKEKARRVLGR